MGMHSQVEFDRVLGVEQMVPQHPSEDTGAAVTTAIAALPPQHGATADGIG